VANYGVKFNGSGKVTTAQWTSGLVFSVRMRFKTGALAVTQGIIGKNADLNDYLALYADGKYSLKGSNVSFKVSNTGLMVANTEYVIEFGRTGSTLGYVNLYQGDGTTLIDTETFTTDANFVFDRLGVASTLISDITLWAVDITGGTQSRNYISTINTGTNWSEIAGGQDGTLASLATDGSEWVLDAAVATPITFTGTIPNLSYNTGDVVSEDLSSYFSGAATPFTSTSIGTVLTGTGLTLDTSFVLSGTATESAVTGVVVTGTDIDLATADSNAFNITIAAAALDPTRAEIEASDETGGTSPPFLVNDFEVGDASTDEFAFTIDNQPSDGVLVTDEFSRFTFSGAAIGSYSFDYTGYKNGVSYGSATVYIEVVAISSTLNLTATGIPDGTYLAEIWDAGQDPMVRLSVLGLDFSGDTSKTTVDLAVGTLTKTIIDGSNPPETGVLCYGVTE